MAGIFISYRREDTAAEARLLFDGLAIRFGVNMVFMDVEKIGVGRDFHQVIRETTSSCNVLLAVIGKKWIDIRNDAGGRRLDDSTDLLRTEIATAFKGNLLVIPVLVQGASLPAVGQLPSELRFLAGLNAIALRHDAWSSDIERLARALAKDTQLRPIRGVPKMSAVTWGRLAVELGAICSAPILANRLELMDPPYWRLVVGLGLVLGTFEVLLRLRRPTK